MLDFLWFLFCVWVVFVLFGGVVSLFTEGAGYKQQATDQRAYERDMRRHKKQQLEREKAYAVWSKVPRRTTPKYDAWYKKQQRRVVK